ncbi:CDF family zinc transporter ZitB [Enterobacillus tribolii]|uniref:Zinc transporter ZitB n=1 Tax=Enterobacillus tribolii TaxID=1487935 RepID=A0A370QHJ1_9GAMM|nr:CDF family zinc transporter ZitB [Enterobacillus tribolii]MBW7982554.1 CDF family zinc transporter ZitB [Enterobacillus tribolii]RDK87834.1 cobalt-zinc-cadmium efflux system protein [Enterobacillus tribolii]
MPEHTHASPATHDGNSRRLVLAFVVTALFMIAEVAGGIISGSLALLADAGHMLTDAAALLVAILAVRFARRDPTAQHSFGYLRLTTLAAFVNAAALMVIVVIIVWEAIRRFLAPAPVMGPTMLAVAVAGLLANLLAFWLLHHGSEEKNINVRAAALHVLGDLLGSVGAIAAAIVIMWTGWTPIDPILSVLVSCLVLRSAWRLLKESTNELLEGTPLGIDSVKLQKALCREFPEVRNVHHVHIWQIGEQRLMTLHVHVIPPHDHDALLDRLQHYLEEHYHIGHATIQMEYQGCEEPDCDLTHHAAQSAGHAHHHH